MVLARATVGALAWWRCFMLFLMNDRVLKLDDGLTSTAELGRFEEVSPSFAVKLGQELYAEQPLLQREAPGRARRLAMLIRAKAPGVNAALFVAPAVGCRPDQVITRFASLTDEAMDSLCNCEAQGGLTTVQADRQVWRRLAA